jgi:hypothetical protein
MLGPIAGVTISPVPTPLVVLLMLELPLPKLRYFVAPSRSMLLAGNSVDGYWPPPVPADDGVSPVPTDPWKNPMTGSPATVTNGDADAFATAVCKYDSATAAWSIMFHDDRTVPGV